MEKKRCDRSVIRSTFFHCKLASLIRIFFGEIRCGELGFIPRNGRIKNKSSINRVRCRYSRPPQAEVASNGAVFPYGVRV
jgi:hypothetical protein